MVLPYGKAIYGKPCMASHAWQAMHGKAIYGKAMHGKAMHGKAMHGKAMRSLPRPRPLFAIETWNFFTEFSPEKMTFKTKKWH